MGYVQIRISQIASHEDLHRWEDHMQEKARCWNKFCLGLCDERHLCAVHVVKENAEDVVYLTTLCEDCIKETASYGILVNENHLIPDMHPKR